MSKQHGESRLNTYEQPNGMESNKNLTNYQGLTDNIESKLQGPPLD